MIRMAKQPKKTASAPLGRPPGAKREFVAFQLRIAVPLHAQLLKALGMSRRTKNAECELAIEEHLTTLGLWPIADNKA